MFILAHIFAFALTAFATLVLGHNFVPNSAWPGLIMIVAVAAIAGMAIGMSVLAAYDTGHKTDAATPVLSMVGGLMFGLGLYRGEALTDPFLLLAAGILVTMILFDALTPWLERRAEARRRAYRPRRRTAMRRSLRLFSFG